jgi:prokaryotic ubiquitin-like protein Pup
MSEGGQTRKESEPRKDEEQTDAAPTSREQTEDVLEDVDELLDEIDEVLEENAEEFIKNYVQKGGQ